MRTEFDFVMLINEALGFVLEVEIMIRGYFIEMFRFYMILSAWSCHIRSTSPSHNKIALGSRQFQFLGELRSPGRVGIIRATCETNTCSSRYSHYPPLPV
jgi:hypothetical protein